MSEALQQLLQVLQLERLEADLFRGQSQDLGLKAVFGGQVMGQALSAAWQTAPEGLSVNSFHCYFLRPGVVSQPIIYQVERLRDGRSFSTRRVVAIQHGRPICNMAVSFQTPEEGFEHQATMPDVPGPEELTSDLDITRSLAEYLPLKAREKLTAERPIEMRAIDPGNPLAPKARPPQRYAWLRASAPLPEQNAAHAYLLAYAADYNFLITSLYPHARTYWSPGMQVATLDHCMWFHRPFRLDDWLLYVIDSPSASGGRGFVRGQIFTRSGELVASSTQEGVIREWPVGV